MEDVWKEISLSSLHHRSTTATTTNHHGVNLQDFLGRPNSTKNPPPPPPPTTTGDNSHGPSSVCGGAAVFGCLTPPLTTVLSFSSGSDFSYLDQSNPQLQSEDCDKYSSDPRHKRRMKNRESAERSRSRKQAYTNELEKEVTRLMNENAKLKAQLKKVTTAASAQLPKKHTLHRTLTAPF